MSVSRNMELRHLTISQIAQLSQILDRNESWRSLMERIPRNLADLQNETSSAKITRKYSSVNIEEIDSESKKQRRSPTEILLDEWGTSGRRRATVSDLLDLLVQVELYRAADFVAMDILNGPPPKRPETGPGARIDLSLPDSFDERAMEEYLNNASYPASSRLVDDSNSTINNNNRDFNNSANPVKSFRIHSSGESTTDLSESDSHSDLIMFSAKTISTTSNNNAASDMQPTETSQTVYSSDQSSEANSLVQSFDESFIKSKNLPDLSVMRMTPKTFDHSDHPNDSSQILKSSIIPDLEKLRIDQSDDNSINSTTQDNTTSSQSIYIPNLSILNGNGA